MARRSRADGGKAVAGRFTDLRCVSRCSREAGYPVVDDLNTDIVEGFGRIDTNIANGRRASTAMAFARAGRQRGNLDLLSESVAARIIIESGRAKGVEIIRRGARETIWAEREVILCGGTINSPQLLMLSGIGPADHLAQLGILVVHDAPEVGRNLQNHPAYSLRYACSQPVTAYKYLNPGAAIGIGLRYALTGGGSLAESYVATGGYMRSDPSLAVSDTIVVMVPALVTRRPEIGFHVRDLFPERHGFTVMVGSGRPLSRGHILLRSADPTMHPLIYPEYFSEPEDLHALHALGAADARNHARVGDTRANRSGTSARTDRQRRRRRLRRTSAPGARRTSTRAALVAWAPKRPPSSIHGYASTASRACVSPTLRSCRQHSMRVHMHRRS